MEKNVFWEVFQDTGDPLCWLMTREDEPPEPGRRESGEQGESDPPAP